MEIMVSCEVLQWNHVRGSYNHILKYCSPHLFLVKREIVKEERDDTGNKPKKPQDNQCSDEHNFKT